MAYKNVKKKIFEYIKYGDLLLVFSTIITSCITFELRSISSYLDDKNARIQRLKEKPLNYVKINYISYDLYKSLLSVDNENLLIDDISINNISNNNTNDVPYNDDNSTIKDDIVSTAKSIGNKISISMSNLDKLTIQNDSHKNYGNLPPEMQVKKQNNQDEDYFVVQANFGKRQSIEDLKKNGKKHVELYNNTDDNQSLVGTIGGQEIRKETIKETLINIWYSALHIKKKKYNSLIVNTNYDRYGNKRNNNVKKTTSVKNNKLINDNIQLNNINELQNGIDTNNNSYIQHIILDGNLQKLTDNSSMSDSNVILTYDMNLLLVISRLEYQLELCWSKYAKKYNNTSMSYTYLVSYDVNGLPTNVKFIRKTLPEFQEDNSQMMKKDIQDTIERCNILEVNGLNDNNYKFWKDIEITFTGSK